MSDPPLPTIASAFASARAEGRPAFIPYITAGFPSPAHTVPLLLALERGGADVIEVGVPFSDPMADGPTIQHSNTIALSFKVRGRTCLRIGWET